jgi:hypothetical protein
MSEARRGLGRVLSPTGVLVVLACMALLVLACKLLILMAAGGRSGLPILVDGSWRAWKGAGAVGDRTRYQHYRKDGTCKETQWGLTGSKLGRQADAAKVHVRVTTRLPTPCTHATTADNNDSIDKARNNGRTDQNKTRQDGIV